MPMALLSLKPRLPKVRSTISFWRLGTDYLKQSDKTRFLRVRFNEGLPERVVLGGPILENHLLLHYPPTPELQAPAQSSALPLLMDPSRSRQALAPSPVMVHRCSSGSESPITQMLSMFLQRFPCLPECICRKSWNSYVANARSQT